MSAPTNKFFGLQQRLADLIAADDYFAGVPASQILTEQVGDIQYQVENVLLPLGFGIVITTASGKDDVSSYEALTTLEDLNVSIVHNPTTDPAHSALDALAAAIDAIHGASVQVTPPLSARASDYFAVTGHQRRLDGPPNTHVHELHVTGGLRLK